MNGKVLGGAIVIAGLLAGVAIYYLQTVFFYEDVVASEDLEVLVTLIDGEPDPILAENVRAIDATSSPIRYRACFDTPMSIAMMTETYELYENAEPLIAPNWFECFDAKAIGAGLKTGDVIAFLGVENIEFGIDRIVAVDGQGKGYVWHQINACGEEVFDGNPAPAHCPARDVKE